MPNDAVEQEFEVESRHVEWLDKISDEYNFMDESKALRVLLDYAIQDGDKELIFADSNMRAPASLVVCVPLQLKVTQDPGQFSTTGSGRSAASTATLRFNWTMQPPKRVPSVASVRSAFASIFADAAWLAGTMAMPSTTAAIQPRQILLTSGALRTEFALDPTTAVVSVRLHVGRPTNPRHGVSHRIAGEIDRWAMSTKP